MTAFPGQQIGFDITAYDELMNSVYSVPVASFDNKKASKTYQGMQLKKRYYIVEPNKKTSESLQYVMPSSTYKQMLNGQSNIETVRFVDSYSSFLSNVSIRIEAARCRPGFVFDRSGVCACDVYSNKNIVRWIIAFVYFTTLCCREIERCWRPDHTKVSIMESKICHEKRSVTANFDVF